MRIKAKKRSDESFNASVQMYEVTAQPDGLIRVEDIQGRWNGNFKDLDEVHEFFNILWFDEAYQYWSLLQLKELEIKRADKPFSEMTVREHYVLEIWKARPNMTPYHVIGEANNLLELLNTKDEEIKSKITEMNEKRREIEANIPAQLR